MTISTDDCKNLLATDSFVIAAGATDLKGWKRLSKRKGPLGIERVFKHKCGVYAKVIEAGSQLYVLAAAVTEEELDDPMNQRGTPVQQGGPTTVGTASASTVVLASPTLHSQAKNLVDSMLAAFCEDDDLYEDLMEKVENFDKTAIANQYTFAVIKAEDFLIATITPTSYWLTEGCCYDQGSPIGHILPDGSDDLNECGTWVIPQYQDSTPIELAKFLLSKGFVWDKDFQDFMDETSLEPTMNQLEELLNTGNADVWYKPRLADAFFRAEAKEIVDAYNEASQNYDDNLPVLRDSILALDPLATANQYMFAISLYDDYLIAQITPTHYWKTTGYCLDKGSPLEHVLPEGSFDLNEGGTWVIAGYKEIVDDSTPLALAKYMLKIGFSWDRKFQELIDTSGDEPMSHYLTELIKATNSQP